MSLQILKNLGFSDLDIKIYEILLSKDKEKNELMNELNIDEETLEKSIVKMKELGAIDIIGNTIIALHPSSFLNKYLKIKEIEINFRLNELRNIINEAREILEQIYDEKKYGIRREELWQSLNSLTDMEIETIKIISHAQNEILILTEKFSYYPKIREELLLAKARGVNIKIIFLKPNEDIIKELKINGFEIKHFNYWRNIRFTIVDKKEAVFLIWAKKIGGDRIFYRPGYTKNLGIIEILMDTFTHLWEKAIPL
ncbi:MAG: TrmB family transcriptional regulator sugar-binding domain-containing protein [Candidatus Methanomethylicaceae archaeon]|nr:TrmB family transcriptional regulator sugar-binding domain-containing protein [Candidatus Verstraetearchaeota archaeon]